MALQIASMSADGMKAAYGARPSKAFLLEDAENILKDAQTLSEEEKKADEEALERGFVKLRRMLAKAHLGDK